MTRHLILFARVPRLGAVKSRLARDIGAVAAWRFAERTTRAMAGRLGRDPRWRTWLCLTPDAAAADPGLARRWRLPAGVAVIAQGRGDLGVRMARALAAVPPGPRLLIGSDIPGVDRADIADAFARLGDADLVFGPAEDGGFWLVGARDAGAVRGLFDGVRWSTRHALADTRANVPPRRSVALAARKRDVDDGAAYVRVTDMS
jgi:rSAM/selenodomain-associated transferase 1